MKAMLASFAAIVVIAVGAYYTLSNLGFSSEEQGAAPSVRLD